MSLRACITEKTVRGRMKESEIKGECLQQNNLYLQDNFEITVITVKAFKVFSIF